MPGPYDVAIVLVGLNARDYIRQCLLSIERAEWRQWRYEVVYVDNGSRDDSVDLVRREFPSVKVIAKPSNVGYTPAANEGAAVTSGRYLLFLNDDTIVLDDAIPLLVELLEQRPDIGIVGHRLLYPDHSEQYSARKYPRGINAFLGRRGALSRLLANTTAVKQYLYKDQLQQTEPFACDWVSAAGEMVRRDCFTQVGGFPADYYYWHETLFSYRAEQAGWATYLHPQSKVIHYEGHGSGPRPYAAQKFHIVNFHEGAFRLYCEMNNAHPASPQSWLVWSGLQVRMYLLLGRAWFTELMSKRSKCDDSVCPPAVGVSS